MDQFKKFRRYLGQLQLPTMVHHLNLPTLAIRWVQVRVTKWLKNQYTMPGIIFMPILTKIFDRIEIINPRWIPLMPNHLLPSVQLGIALTTPLIASQHTMIGGEPSLAPMAILALTAPMVPMGDQTLGVQINNPHHNAIFNPFWTKASPCTQTIHQKAVQGQILVPLKTDGHPVCLAFHIKGMCNTKCTHTHNHGPQEAAKSQALLARCKLHWKI